MIQREISLLIHWLSNRDTLKHASLLTNIQFTLMYSGQLESVGENGFRSPIVNNTRVMYDYHSSPHRWLVKYLPEKGSVYRVPMKMAFTLGWVVFSSSKACWMLPDNLITSRLYLHVWKHKDNFFNGIFHFTLWSCNLLF